MPYGTDLVSCFATPAFFNSVWDRLHGPAIVSNTTTATEQSNTASTEQSNTSVAV